ncbi:MAG: ParB/RepB/Spo0J family partition protein [Candidatus Sumerlaeia bacterium]|nr:ParB/RepB/Spo0J family partition protein [Candidatus Sumerlaeia bacterium]
MDKDLAIHQLALDDRTFDLGFARRYDRLRQSVQALGIVQPILIRQAAAAGTSQGTYQIVCGFGRARLAGELGIPHIPARLLPTSASDFDCLQLALFDNLSHRHLNPIERAIALDRLGRHVGREAVVARYLPLLDLQPSGVVLERTLRLLALIEPLKLAVAEGRIEEKTGVLLAGWEPADQNSFAQLLASCIPTVSVAREWAENLDDMARRDRCAVRDVLSAPELTAAWGCEDTAPSTRCAAVRRAIHRLRYPTLSAQETAFEVARAALKLPPDMRLEAAPNFESDDRLLTVRFRNPDDLRRAAAALQRWLDNPDLVNALWPRI